MPKPYVILICELNEPKSEPLPPRRRRRRRPWRPSLSPASWPPASGPPPTPGARDTTSPPPALAPAAATTCRRRPPVGSRGRLAGSSRGAPAGKDRSFPPSRGWISPTLSWSGWCWSTSQPRTYPTASSYGCRPAGRTPPTLSG